MIMADDDFRFHTGTEQYPWTAGERYIDAVEYLERNAACGLVLMKGFLGGSQMDRWILPMSHGFYDTGLGLVFPPSRRNEWFYPKLKVLGAGEDVALCMTAFLNGYYCAKMHNVSVNKDHTKKVVALGAATVNVSKSANYNYAKWAFGKRMVELFGEFKHGGSLPVRIRDLYRHNAYKMGFDPVM
jgi:hypothetical protein